jgi:hypothetical protein
MFRHCSVLESGIKQQAGRFDLMEDSTGVPSSTRRCGRKYAHSRCVGIGDVNAPDAAIDLRGCRQGNGELRVDS